MSETLIERLNAHATYTYMPAKVREACAEAATTLERVERERDACADKAVEQTLKLDAAEAQVEAMRMALEGCRTSIAGYHLRHDGDARQLVDEFFNELQRIHKVAVAALSAPVEEGETEDGLQTNGERHCADPQEVQPGVTRDMAGETVCGFRVAAYRETHPEHGDRYGHRYSEHWSTPSQNPVVKIERLFTETQLRAALASSTPESSVEVASTAFDWRCKPPEIPSVDRVISYLRDYGPGTPDTTDCYMMRWAADHLANLESRANHWQRVAETPAESKP